MFKVPSYCVVTGASRGLGREVALQIAGEWNKEGRSYVSIWVPLIVELEEKGML